MFRWFKNEFFIQPRAAANGVRKPDTREWLIGVLKHALRQYGEEQADIEFLVDLET